MPMLSQMPGVAGTLEAGHISLALGGGTGIVRGGSVEDGLAAVESPVSLYVLCGGFRGVAAEHLIDTPGGRVGPVTAPTGGSAGDLRRKDLIQYSYGAGFAIKTGSESGSPVAPAADTGAIAVAEIWCRNGMSSIKGTDDGVNGQLVDARAFL